MLEWYWRWKTDVIGEKPIGGSLVKLHLWNKLRSRKINRVLWVTKLFWSCVLGAMCHCCWAKCSGSRRINKCLIWCLPARSCIQQVCARSMSHKSLRPCCFRFTTRTVHVSAMRRDAVPSGLKQMAQIELRKTTEWPDLPLTSISHAVTWLTIQESGICSRLNVFWDSERLDVMDCSVTVLL
jgi:hypothetical protein